MKLLNRALLSVMLITLSTSYSYSSEQNIKLTKDVKRWGSIPITKDEVYFLIPEDFPMNASRETNSPGLYQAEFFPNGQSKETWKDKLRLMAFQGIPKGNDPPAIQMLGIIGQPIKAACPNEYFLISKEQKERTRASAIMGCRKLSGNSSQAIFGYYLVIQSEESMYVFARETRQTSFSGELPIAESIQREWQAQVDQTTVCRRNEMCISKLVQQGK